MHIFFAPQQDLGMRENPMVLFHRENTRISQEHFDVPGVSVFFLYFIILDEEALKIH